MFRPRVLVLRAAGTNCDVETAEAFRLAGAQAERVHVHRLISGAARLEDYHLLVLPGGFSYGDDLGAGRVLALELATRLGAALPRFVDAGKLVLGICNGFQVLVRLGLLPGPGPEPSASLAPNLTGRFEDRWVALKAVSRRSDFMVEAPPLLYLPVAHAEGRFVPASEEVRRRLHEEGQVVFAYVSDEGEATTAYPANPNGSVDGIAGVCDETGRVLGLMPHPERHVLATQHPGWTRGGGREAPDGLTLFRGAVSCLRERFGG